MRTAAGARYTVEITCHNLFANAHGVPHCSSSASRSSLIFNILRPLRREHRHGPRISWLGLQWPSAGALPVFAGGGRRCLGRTYTGSFRAASCAAAPLATCSEAVRLLASDLTASRTTKPPAAPVGINFLVWWPLRHHGRARTARNPCRAQLDAPAMATSGDHAVCLLVADQRTT